VFDQRSTQEQVYRDAVDPLVGEVVSGYNVTVMAYGQTGSGKTFTMGTSGDDDVDDEGNNALPLEKVSNEALNAEQHFDERGMTPRCIADLFQRLDDTGLSYEVTCSVLELYKDELRDLQRGGEYLDPGQQLRIQEVSGSIVVKNLVEITCQSPADVLRCLRQSSCNRAVGSTEMNAVSSRSHMVCRLTIQQFPSGSDGGSDQSLPASKAPETSSRKEDAEPAVTSQLTFVDLAGSERLKKTMATGNRKREGIAINKGLFHLGRVINANAMGKNDPHIYRVSKLTRLLQNALGGNSKTLFIACVSPAASNTDETLSTLRYANAAKNIQNKAVVNRSPQEIALLRAAIKLNAMTFEYVRVAHGALGKATDDDAVHNLLASNDVVRNDIAAIQSKALENRRDLQSTTVSKASHNQSRGQPQHQQLREHRHHHRSNSGSMPQSGHNKPQRRTASNTSQNATSAMRRGVPTGANATHEHATASCSQTTGKPESTAPMTDEDRQKFARLIETVEASEKEMQAEHLAMINELETAEGERAEEEESSKRELEEALRNKEAAWQEIKEILVLYPAVQAEAEALKEEVGKIEQERTALEAECAAAEEHLKAQGGDGKLVKRLKAKVAELKGLHERKKREAKKKTDELTSMKRQQQRATDMKHEIEELKRQKTVQQRAHQRRVRDHREQLAKHRKLVAKSERFT
jgi:kinesin family protein 4/21/27